MIRLRIFLLAALPTLALGANSHGMKVSKVQAAELITLKQNVQFETWVEQLPRENYEGIYATFGGVEENAGKATIRRLARDHFRKIQVGYAVTLERDPGGRGTLLSFGTFLGSDGTPAAVPKGYEARSPEALPVPQLVQDGDVFKLVLHTRSLGTKLVEYIRIGGPPVAELREEPPRDSYAEDAEFTVSHPKFRANGRIVKAAAVEDFHAAALRVAIPGFGRYVLSLKEHPESGFENAGEVFGSSLTFMVKGNLFRIDCSDQIGPGSAPYNVYAVAEAAGADEDRQTSATIGPDPVLGVSLTGSESR